MSYLGKLHKKEDHWVVRYKMEDDMVATDGGEISVHPDDVNGVLAADIFGSKLQGKEVEFEIVNFMFDTVVAKIINKDTEPYVSDDFQIGPDGAYEHIDEWDPDYMDGVNEDTWFDEMDINPHWKKCLKKYNLSPEIWNVICRLYYGETIALKQSLEEQRYWIDKYHNLKRNIKNLVD